jgi:hypothetical protein
VLLIRIETTFAPVVSKRQIRHCIAIDDVEGKRLPRERSTASARKAPPNSSPS